MTTLTEKAHPGGFLMSEGEFHFSRDNKTLLSGQNLLAGAVLGIISVGTASAAAKGGGNTGNGTITMDPTNPVRPGAKVGVYQVRCIAAATNSGTFRVEDPDGFVLGDTTITGGAGGTATFDDDIKFTLTDAGTDFVAGDGFDVTVAAGSGKVRELNLTANVADGSQNAACILYGAVDASAADAPCVVISRTAEVNGNELNWPAGISGPQKTAAIAQLAAVGIIVR